MPARISYTRPVTRAWLILGLCAAPFLGIIGYSQRGVVMDWRQQRAEDAVYDEISELGPEHPWAGHYYAGDGLGFNTAIALAPKAGYVFYRFGDGGPWSEAEIGSIAETKSGVQARRPCARELLEPLIPVPWGERRYLIPRDELKDFANAINLGDEPRTMAQGSYLMRDGDESLPADGRPFLPAEASALLRDRPLDAKIIGVGVDTYKSFQIEPGLVWKTTGTLVLLDIGRHQGALPGLELRPQSHGIGKAVILRVGDKSSTAMFWRDDMTPDRPARGWLVSTRPQWKRHVDKPLAPLPAQRRTAKEARRDALEAARDALPYEKARQRVWELANANSLGVSVDVWRHLSDARIEYLPAKARAVLQQYMGINQRYGTIGLDSFTKIPWESWNKHVMETAGPELAALKASNPEADAELARFNREIDALY